MSLPLATDAKPIRFLFLPEGEDPDSFIRKHGREALEQKVREAQTLSGFLLSDLRAGSDLSTPEGRSKYLVAAKPYLQKLSAPALRLQLLKEVADLARVSQEEARHFFEIRNPSAFARSAPPKAAAPIAGSQERNLLRCVLAKPTLAAELDEALLDPSLPESAALRAIADLEDAGGLNGALLLDRFQGTELEAIVVQVQASALEHDLGEESADHDFRQIQLALRIKRINEEIEVLKGRVKADPGLNAELGARVKQLHQLKTQRI